MGAAFHLRVKRQYRSQAIASECLSEDPALSGAAQQVRGSRRREAPKRLDHQTPVFPAIPLQVVVPAVLNFEDFTAKTY